jgi:hypothetical protein
MKDFLLVFTTMLGFVVAVVGAVALMAAIGATFGVGYAAAAAVVLACAATAVVIVVMEG